jgi:hypothetical protein
VVGADPFAYRERFFFDLLRDWKRTFPLNPDEIHVTGFSAGGFGSFWYGCRHPYLFAAAAPMAGNPPHGWWERGFWEPAFNIPWAVFHGEKDEQVPVGLARDIVQKWTDNKAAGYRVVYKEYPGADHNRWFGPDVANIERMVMDELFDVTTRDPFPKKVIHIHDAYLYESFYRLDPIPQSYWVSSTGFSGRHKGIIGRITAERAGNKIDVRSEAVSGVTVWVAPEMVDLTKPVEIKHNGAVRFSGGVKPSVEALLASLNRFEDVRLRFVAKIALD